VTATRAARASRTQRPPWPPVAVAMAVLVVALLVSALPLGPKAGPSTTGATIGGFALVLMFLILAAVGLVVARFQRRNPIGYLLLGAAVCFLITLDSGGYATIVYAQHDHLPLGAVALVLSPFGMLAVVMLPLIVLLFPDGRLPSGRWGFVLVIALVLAGYSLAANEAALVAGLAGHRLRVNSDGTPAINGWVSHTATLAALAAVLALIVAAVVRQVLAWRHAGTDRRQQIKWLISGVCVFLVIGLPSLGVSSSLWEAGIAIGFAALPLAIGVGILRYRLYDIDRIVSRTVSYGIVTALLAGVYAGVVLLATRELRFSSEVAVAVSTLAAAAAFNPVRRRVQHLVDRRFNRARYDADLIVAAFAARLQDGVDIAAVEADLGGTVQRALEPEHLSVWTWEA
jgi:MFS family permease